MSRFLFFLWYHGTKTHHMKTEINEVINTDTTTKVFVCIL